MLSLSIFSVITANVYAIHLMLLQGYYYEHDSRLKQKSASLEQQIRAASNVRELLSIINSSDWKRWKCRQKLKYLAGFDTRSRSTRFASPYYDAETLKSIDDEWRRTQCVPRESCVDVAKELGRSTNTFFKPPCVSAFRCGGCCNEESLVCKNISTSYIRKELFEISIPLTNIPELLAVRIANHTSCKCISSRHAYSIIRRSILTHEHRDNRTNRLAAVTSSCLQDENHCSRGLAWDEQKCHCVTSSVQREDELSPIAELAICGPYMEFNEEKCDCVCRNMESHETCSQKQKAFDPDSCSLQPLTLINTPSSSSSSPIAIQSVVWTDLPVYTVADPALWGRSSVISTASVCGRTNSDIFYRGKATGNHGF
ncbi:vascular endothelial growth factor D isoform X2 [Scyliorhinus canicula]|uniref:vascular endothelial growth factor D isoform X2 n=1 Tax=Scyliorhinus canicula TaxID=7830 RepID=UPI0018F35635|nr:vascular endothelial growth factor D isoform X2 [Scyliorhinus canicula]